MVYKIDKYRPYVVAALPKTAAPTVHTLTQKKSRKSAPLIASGLVASPVGVPVVENFKIYKTGPERWTAPELNLEDRKTVELRERVEGKPRGAQTVPDCAVVAGNFPELAQALHARDELNANPRGFRFDAASAERFAVESLDGDAPDGLRQLELFTDAA